MALSEQVTRRVRGSAAVLAKLQLSRNDRRWPRPRRPWRDMRTTFRVFHGRKRQGRHCGRFPDPWLSAAKNLQASGCKRERNPAQEKVEFGASEARSLWQLARNLVLLSSSDFPPFSPKRRTTARHASTQSAKDAMTRDISCKERDRARMKKGGLLEGKKGFAFFCLPLFFVSRTTVVVFFPTPLVDHRDRERRRNGGSPIPPPLLFLSAKSIL